MVIRVENQTTPTTKDNTKQHAKQNKLSIVVLCCSMLFEMVQRSIDVTLWLGTETFSTYNCHELTIN